MQQAVPGARRWLKGVLALVVVGLLLMGLAWWGLPVLLLSQLPPRLSQALGRPVALQAVQVDPWRMALTLGGLRIGAAPSAGDGASAATGPAGEPLLEVGQVAVDIDLPGTLRHRAPVVESLAIDGLRLRLARTAPGRYDIDDLIERFGRSAAPSEPGEPARYALYNLALRDAQIRLDDRPVGVVHTLQSLTLTLPFLSNLPADVAVHTEPRLAFSLNGTRLDSGSKVLPFADTRRGDLNLGFADLDLAPWLGYLPASLPVRLQKGRVSSQLALQFSMPVAGAPTVVLKGSLGLNDVALTEPGGAPLAAWQTLALDLRDVQPLARRLSLGDLRIGGLLVVLSRDAQGVLNLQRLQAPAPGGRAGAAGTAPRGAAQPPVARASAAHAAAPASASAASTGQPAGGWQLALASFNLDGAQVRWHDATLRPAAQYTLADLAVQLKDLRWPTQAPMPLTASASLRQGGADGSALARLSLAGGAHDRQASLGVKVDGLDLAGLAPYLAGALKPRLSGRLSTDARLTWAADPAVLSVDVASALLNDLQLRDGPGKAAPSLASLLKLQVSGAKADLQARKLVLARVQIDKPALAVVRGRDGRLNLQQWAADAPPAKAPSASAAPAGAPAALPWQVQLQDLVVHAGRLQWADAATPVGPGQQPLRAELNSLQLRLQGLAWPAPAGGRAPLPSLQLAAKLGSPAQADATAALGDIGWAGRFGLAPLQADGRLTLRRLPVHLFVPYAGQSLPAQLMHADASLALQVRAAQQAGGWQVATDGDMQLTEVLVHSPANAADATDPGSELLSWQTLSLQGLSVALAPGARPRVEVRELLLDDFFSKLVITEQGRFNLQDVAAQPGNGATAPTPTPAASASVSVSAAASAPAVVAQATPAASTANAGAAAAAGGDLPIDLVLGSTQLRNGRVDFSDRFIRPNYSAKLTELNGQIGTIRSGTREMATISLRGRAADTALLDISGQLNPTAQPLALDIRAKATDLELAPLSPYAGKYAGYAIERGKLSMDVAYKIDADGKLDAKNQVILNQLTFGEKVDSPSATKLPVLLAVALLKDRNGVIDLNLPVSGTLSDPQFSVGGLIWKVIVNLLGKALTAPFALLGGGGADDLSQVAFVPGTARVTDGGRQALDKVAKALAERPSLIMTVTGAADTVSEREQAQKWVLEERLLAERRRERLRAAPAGAAPGVATAAATAASAASGVPALRPPEPPIAAADRARLLKQLYQQTPLPDRPRNLINQLKDLPAAEMESRLLAGVLISEDTMRELALQRGLAVRDALIGHGLPSERLFIAAPKLRLSGEDDAAWVPKVSLTLSAR